MYGPVEGRRNDMTLLRESGWSTKFEEHLIIDNRQFYVYGDSAYSIRPWIQKHFIGCLTDEQKQCNRTMSMVRVSVEHRYKELKQKYPSQDFARKMHVRQSPIGQLYRVCALLWNFR